MALLPRGHQRVFKNYARVLYDDRQGMSRETERSKAHLKDVFDWTSVTGAHRFPDQTPPPAGGPYGRGTCGGGSRW